MAVADHGVDVPGCGQDVTSPCRSISQAIALADAGDTILVGPGRYGDLNDNGRLDEAGEEHGAPERQQAHVRRDLRRRCRPPV